jgi:hypothetical protein
VLLEWSGKKKGEAEQMNLRVFPVKIKKTLSEFKVSSKDASEDNSSHSWSTYAELQEGEAIQAELSYGTTVKVSPVYKP